MSVSQSLGIRWWN